ncbi:MAG: ribosome maturation factor RimM [Chloroflexota bacterium]|nr:ribosome maturation factor RimM [Chloroflexota bacterium]
MESVREQSSEIADGYVAIGRIGGCHGVRGDVKVTLHTDHPDRFLNMDHLFLGPEARPIRVLASRPHQNKMLLKLEGYEDRTTAEELRGLWIQIPLEEVAPLAEGEHYIFQLEGLRVATTGGAELGEVRDVLFTGANQVLIVRGEGREILIPFIQDVVLEVDVDGGRIVVEPVAGLLD